MAARTRRTSASPPHGQDARDRSASEPGQEPRVPRRRRPAVPGVAPAPEKAPFDIDVVIRRVRQAVKELTPAAMFQLRDEGFTSVFEQLVACIISIRTFDEVSLPTARKLFAVARTPREVAQLSVAQIDELIRASTFHGPKAKTIHNVAAEAVERHGGAVPADREVVLGFRGVGPKCANLALGVATGEPYGIPVDIHVHRVTNRWGYVQGKTPEETMAALEEKLPKKYWLEINRLLVPFGKHVCTGTAPRCSACPVLEMCRQVGVKVAR